MKKTQTINLGGLVFHIDEDAYAALKKYLGKLEKELKGEMDVKEVMGDIESRIAEILSDKLANKREVVTIDDVNAVIEVIGDPEIIGDPESAAGATKHASGRYERYERKSYRRMYRDPDNRIIGGVCGGLSAYMNIDPVFLRIVIAILAVFGGSGIFIYLIFWIILPEAHTPAQKLEMRGEPITFENIKSFVSREYNNVRDSFSKKK
ncbi:MAG: PspC domain-containing protein [Bacteroidales bacterium]|nr:PspC domain-containing protein [Bacteroidales bacterium]